MQKAWLFLPMLLALSSPAWGADEKSAHPNPPAFLGAYKDDLKPLDALYEDLESENLPLLDETGQPVGHRPLENRRQALAELRNTLDQLRQDPENLVSVTETFIQTESLSDDLYDLSQIAYDNDREDLGRWLAELVSRLDEERGDLESYARALAARKEFRIHELESENERLRENLKQIMGRESAQSSHN
jgi:vacuolar-type H+-ATPase subunit I/STV1